MDQKYIVALELSGTQIKGAVATMGTLPDGKNATPTIEAIASEDNTGSVQYGRVQNLLNAAKYTKYVIQRLQSDPAVDDGKINGAYIGLSGRSLGSEQTTVEITLPNETLINEEMLKDLYIEASKMVSQNRKVLKVLPRKFVVDNQTTSPIGALGRKLRGDFTLVTCNPTHQRNIDLVFSADQVGLPIKGYVITPLAVADMVLDEEEKQLGCVLVDIGHQTTTISIYKDRALQYLATLPMGSYNITHDISVGLNITLEKAESLKCSHGDALEGNSSASGEAARINSYVAARAYEIVANIYANIGYAKYKAADLSGGIILAGRGARLKNLETLLSNQTKMRVRYASIPSNVKIALSTNNIRPQDYLSLVAIVLRAARMPKFTSCVTFDTEVQTQPEETAVQQPTPTATQQQPVQQQPAQQQPVQQPVTPQPPVQTPPAKQTTTQIPDKQPEVRNTDDEDWASDNDVTPTKPTKKPKKSLLARLKEQATALLSSDLDGDASLD